MQQPSYLMEHPDECTRLAMKTKADKVLNQAVWAGIAEGMHVLDAGCGVGKTTSILKELVGDTGSVTGLDSSPQRLQEARKLYGREGVKFVEHDLRDPFEPEEVYDAVWMRFFLEYFLNDPLSIVRHAISRLKPGGLLVLVDLDKIAMSPYSARFDKTIQEVMDCLEHNRNFDPYAGRRLYGHMIDLGMQEVRVEMEPHHLIYGDIDEINLYNWIAKAEVAGKTSGCDFKEYGGDFTALLEDFRTFLNDPRRFIFTPMILCRGIKPE